MTADEAACTRHQDQLKTRLSSLAFDNI
jgi:hypothetical protein